MGVKLVPFNFENLAHLDDGRIDKLLKAHVARATQDCLDRPGDKTKRHVTLKISIEPIIDDSGQCESTHVEIECLSKVPVFRSRTYEMRATKAGMLFNADFPDELDQQPLFDRSGMNDAKPNHSGE